MFCSVLYQHYFEGQHLFGVGSNTLHSKLIAGIFIIFIILLFLKGTEHFYLHHSGDSDDIAIQRWRSMSVDSVEAMFQMDEDIDFQLDDELTTQARRTLELIYQGLSR
jgi:hypothetical protein